MQNPPCRKIPQKKDAEIAALRAKLEAAETAKALAVTEAVAAVEKERNALSSQLSGKDLELRLAVTEAVHVVKQERDALANELKAKVTERQLLEANLNEKHLAGLKNRNNMIAYLRI